MWRGHDGCEIRDEGEKIGVLRKGVFDLKAVTLGMDLEVPYFSKSCVKLTHGGPVSPACTSHFFLRAPSYVGDFFFSTKRAQVVFVMWY